MPYGVYQACVLPGAFGNAELGTTLCPLLHNTTRHLSPTIILWSFASYFSSSFFCLFWWISHLFPTFIYLFFNLFPLPIFWSFPRSVPTLPDPPTSLSRSLESSKDHNLHRIKCFDYSCYCVSHRLFLSRHICCDIILQVIPFMCPYSFFLPLSISVYISLSLSLPISLSRSLALSLSVNLSLSLFLPLYLRILDITKSIHCD